MEKIKIGLIDDQQLFCDGITAVINSVSDFTLVIEAHSASDFLKQLPDLLELPDIVLLDMHLPGINGIELNEMLHKSNPLIKVLVVTAYDQQRFVLKMIENGACGFLSKNCSAQELITAIRTIAKSGFYFNDLIVKTLQNGRNVKSNNLKNINSIPFELTKREHEILILICKEYSTEEIAKQLFVSIRTIEGHRRNLLQKAGCKNIAGLVIFAVRNNLVGLIA
ncbi:MAG TPA: response regulator transcription factor [Chitinophagaceae bacterium]|nr:response regulator transcription factor [Chitinophagaceae bacterium]